MKQLQIYLTFNGNCKEAVEFYKSVFGGEIISSQTFGEAGMLTDDAEYKDQIMHCQYKSGDIYLMASDNMKGHPFNAGNNVALSIDYKDGSDMDKDFNALATGGAVDMPLQVTFWNAKFGMLTDKFGIRWMMNHDLPKE